MSSSTTHAFAPSSTYHDVADALEVGPDVLAISLLGEVGKTITGASVRRQLARLRDFRHLHISISSGGGSLVEAFALFELLRVLPVPISASAAVSCHSAAMIIFMAADLRIAKAGASFLIHPASISRDDLAERLTAQSSARRVSDLEAIDLRIARLFAARTGYDLAWFCADQRNEEYLSEVDAVESGIVHEFEPLTGHVDPRWPDQARRLQDAGIYAPPRLLTQNYFAACRCAASLRRATL
jgi:ATP-dependent protease ClpP protease subunit